MRYTRLIEILFSDNVRLDEKDDALMVLANFDGIEVVNTLVKVASDPSNHPILQSSSAESLAEIWVRTNSFDVEKYNKLTGLAKGEIRAAMKSKFPLDENL